MLPDNKTMNIPLFISEIRKREALWDPSNRDYYCKKTISDLWLEIGALFNIEVPTAKQKWKNLRDTFRVEVKKTKYSGVGEDSEIRTRSLWGYYDDMLFLKHLLKTRKSRDLVEPEIVSQFATAVALSPSDIKVERDMTFSPTPLDERSDTFIENFPVPSRHTQCNNTRENTRKRMAVEDGWDNCDEEDDMLFFRSLIPFVKKLDPSKKLLFRMNVQKMLYEELYSDNKNSN